MTENINTDKFNWEVNYLNVNAEIVYTKVYHGISQERANALAMEDCPIHDRTIEDWSVIKL